MSRMVFTISAVKAWQVGRPPWVPGTHVALRSPSHLALAKDGLRGPGAELQFTRHRGSDHVSKGSK